MATIAADMAPKRSRGLYMSVWRMMGAAGGLIGSVMAGAIIDLYTMSAMTQSAPPPCNNPLFRNIFQSWGVITWNSIDLHRSTFLGTDVLPIIEIG